MIKKTKDKNNPLVNSVNVYLAHLQFERRLSENTLYAYKYDLKSYTDYLFNALGINKIQLVKPPHIEEFVKSLNISDNANKHRKIKKSC